MRWLPLFVAVSACGSAPAAPAPATHDDFRAIQRHEAKIAESRERVSDPDADCHRACEALDDAEAAAESICRIARETSDLDAVARCRRARDQRRELAAVAAGRCECLRAREWTSRAPRRSRTPLATLRRLEISRIFLRRRALRAPPGPVRSDRLVHSRALSG